MGFKLKVDFTRLEILGAILAAMVVAGAIFWWMINLYDERQPLTVLAARADLTAPRMLKIGDLKTLNISRESLPQTAVVDINQVVGQVLTRSLSANEVITTKDLIYDRDPNSEATLVPAGFSGFTLPSAWLSAPFPKVKKNDSISIYAAFPPTRTSGNNAGILASSIRVLSSETNKDGQSTAVLLALTPDIISRLIQARAANYQMIVAVEASGSSLAPAGSL
ncbi:MAG: hypothetical protein EXS55_04415 [Candidatus Magasanikbacteria bacterium]|nr:hypothetical protein [Candidatus Magasanikbacteria bacterium]